jgi:hypothetical protein
MSKPHIYQPIADNVQDIAQEQESTHLFHVQDQETPNTDTTHRTSRFLVVGISAATILGGVGQAVFLPFFISALVGNLSPYFVLSFCGLFFTFFFSLWTAIQYLLGGISGAELRKLRLPEYQCYMFLVCCPHSHSNSSN